MNIREKVFETNSSSSHSVTIFNTEDFFEYVPVQNGSVHIETGEFGWGPETYSDARTKMSYAATYLKVLANLFRHFTVSESTMFDENDKKFVKEFMEKASSFRRKNQMFFKVVKEYLNVQNVFIKDEDGYIDHQSSPVEDDWFGKFFDSEEKLKNFLFNKSYLLEIDNDNH